LKKNRTDIFREYQLLVAVCMLSLILSCQNKAEGDLLIAAAANTQFALTEIVALFEKETNIRADLVFSSSGKLTAQIESGAPFDIFISADTLYPSYLYSLKLSESRPQVYAIGRLALWTAKEEYLLDSFALSPPAVQYLNKTGQLRYLADQLVYGESIQQVNQFVSSGSTDIGITSLSTLRSERLKDVGHHMEIPSSYHDPIYQSMIVLKNGEDRTSRPSVESSILSYTTYAGCTIIYPQTTRPVIF